MGPAIIAYGGASAAAASSSALFHCLNLGYVDPVGCSLQVSVPVLAFDLGAHVLEIHVDVVAAQFSAGLVLDVASSEPSVVFAVSSSHHYLLLALEVGQMQDAVELDQL